VNELFTKSDPTAPAGFFEAEAAGLAWIAEPRAVPVPAVHAVGPGRIVIEQIDMGAPDRSGAEALGHGLAALHAAGSDRRWGAGFGAPWPGFIGPLPMDNGDGPDWPTFYVERRVLPFLQAARDRGAVDTKGAEIVEQVCRRMPMLAGPPEAPSRIHGDLWSGNVVWDRAGTAWIVDPAAHGGHRESDLAMLALFGLPFLDRVLGAYQETAPLAHGWRSRVALHQLHPLLVHAVLFGRGYGVQAVQAARVALRG